MTLGSEWYDMSKAAAFSPDIRAARATRALPAKKSSTAYAGGSGPGIDRKPTNSTSVIRTFRDPNQNQQISIQILGYILTKKTLLIPLFNSF